MKKFLFSLMALTFALLNAASASETVKADASPLPQAAAGADMPSFTATSLTLKPGNNDYMSVSINANNQPVSNFSAEIYVPEHITINTNSFGVPGAMTKDDFKFTDASYDDEKRCYRLSFGSESGLCDRFQVLLPPMSQ